MSALLGALNPPADTSDPQLAQQRLHDVLAMSRYDALRAPPSFLDRFGQWAREGIRNLIRLLFGGSGGGPQVANWIFYLIGAVVLAAVAIVIFRFTRGRFHEEAIATQPSGPPDPSGDLAGRDQL